MAILIDTSVLLGYIFENDANFAKVYGFLKSARKSETLIITQPTLVELFYMTSVRQGYIHAIQAFSSAYAAFQIEALNGQDMQRMQAIMRQYADNHFDFVDVSIMAVAERLRIDRIATFDRRDFMVFRPTHIKHYNLLP